MKSVTTIVISFEQDRSSYLGLKEPRFHIKMPRAEARATELSIFWLSHGGEGGCS